MAIAADQERASVAEVGALARSRLLVTTKEVVELTGYAESTVYRLIAKGELPSVRHGRSVRVAVSDLERWIDDHKDSAA